MDTGAQVSLVRRGLFKEESLQPSRRPVRLKVANGEIMGGGTHEATISMEFWEHERLNRPDLAKRSTLSGNFYVADITDWDMIMGYDFMVANAIGALPHRATLVREDDECLRWLSTDYACGSSQWNAEEEDRIVQAVQAVGAKSSTYDFSSCFFPKFKKSAKRGFWREMTYFFGFYGPKIRGGGGTYPNFVQKFQKP